MNKNVEKAELPAFLINIDLKHNAVVINYMGRKTVININKCRGEKTGLDEEITRLSIRSSDPVAVVPTTMISSLWQIIFGVLNYETIRVYRPSIYEKFKNKGLLLSMLITGMPQLSDVVRILKNEYLRSDRHYFIISLKEEYPIPDNCSDDISELKAAGLEPGHLVKNMNNYLKFV